MPKEEWGTKRVCLTSGKRFYDLKKTPIVSPYTGEILDLESGKGRMIAADAEDAATLKAKQAEDAAEEVTLEDDDTETEKVDLGDDVLDDDDDNDDTVSLDEIADVAAKEEE